MQHRHNLPFPRSHLFILTALLLLLIAGVIYAAADFSVTAAVETPVTSNNADDPAIWIHPTDAGQSVILGTFKDTGIAVFELDGQMHQLFEDAGGINNVDLRYNFPLGDEKVAIGVGTDRNSPRNTLAVFKIDAATRMLESITADPPMDSQVGTVYGTCMYVSPISGKYYAFIVGKDGGVEQWELFDNGAGQVDGTLVRRLELGSIGEGCVADDVHAQLYVGQEDVAIWKFGAEPGDGETGTAVDYVVEHDASGNLSKDVEGLTLYYTSADDGYLIASSQGSSEFNIYERLGDNAFIARFNIVAGNGIDDVSGTDGIDVTNASLGQDFPQGLFVTHDNSNDEGRTNFKYTAWQAVAGGADPDLAIDTKWNPRRVGLPPLADFAANYLTGSGPLTVHFNDHSEGVITSRLWDFGDGSTSTERNPSHLYEQDGIYTVSLVVTNVFGTDDETKIDYIIVDGQQTGAPTAAFSADVTSGEAPLSVNFSNQSSGGMVTCLWEFGDGQTHHACSSPNHVYNSPGSYDVSLTVNNSAGSDQMTRQNYIVVSEPFVATDFLRLPLILYAP
ncbi:MAG: phytase [Candidatus Promineifilaceae bacterium]|nr:phytase [Candidatus Promineifilaceae bacterium]